MCLLAVSFLQRAVFKADLRNGHAGGFAISIRCFDVNKFCSRVTSCCSPIYWIVPLWYQRDDFLEFKFEAKRIFKGKPNGYLKERNNAEFEWYIYRNR